ncbi:MAG: CBS domain-containing protein [Methanosphaera sp.]|uniref:CBS domain-containing protein n=1 Tax=Methanosphaera sp. TaxID=2666342 RepID=UPI0025F122F8|nr:CBS domain-containing protein [Methanosphaera sp.]MCI5867401.1 CBS domain-containing protein [Methanosphaera sp.]MDD6534531.1 CBS domain-containing protein [Methanosphaera sp.]MDY3955800.1 CBS domain-containing protein [Methanosphaera sp.]
MKIKEIMMEDVQSGSVPGTIHGIYEILKDTKLSGLPIVKKQTNEVVGIITRTDLIKNPDEDQIAMVMTRNPVTASPDEDVTSVVQKMINNNIRRVPITVDNELVGIVTSTDIINKALWKVDNIEPVEKYMIHKVPTIWDKTPISVAYSISRYFNFKCVVTLNDEGKVSGILTETDFIRESRVAQEQVVSSSAIGTEGDKWTWNSESVMYIIKNTLKFSDKLVVDVIKDQKLQTVTRKTSAKECASILRQYHIEQIPVINMSREPIGLVRSGDLMRSMIQ